MISQVVLIVTAAVVSVVAEPPVSGYGTEQGYRSGGRSVHRSPMGVGELSQYESPTASISQYGPPGGQNSNLGQNGGLSTRYDLILSQFGSQTFGNLQSKYTSDSSRSGYEGAATKYTTRTGIGNFGMSNGGAGGNYGLLARGNGRYGGSDNSNKGYGLIQQNGANRYGSASIGSYGSDYENNGDGSLLDPVKYEFSYEVNAPEYNVHFAHKESRQGDEANGLYHVLLPDGRTQIVEYNADEEGYKPKVSYQEPSGDLAGVGGYGNAGADGYSNRGANEYANRGSSIYGNGEAESGSSGYGNGGAGATGGYASRNSVVNAPSTVYGSPSAIGSSYDGASIGDNSFGRSLNGYAARSDQFSDGNDHTKIGQFDGSNGYSTSSQFGSRSIYKGTEVSLSGSLGGGAGYTNYQNSSKYAASVPAAVSSSYSSSRGAGD